MRGSRQPGGQPADAVYILEARRPIIRARGLLESVRPAVLDPRIDSTVRIEHLSVKNWRNFKRAEIDIGRRLFIVGPNASGKSNLLDALRFLHDVADRGLRHAVQSRGGMARVRCLSARNNNYGRVALKAVITENTHTKWTYELQLKGTVHPTVAVEKVTKNDERILERPEPTDKKDLKLLTQTALEHVSSNQNFRPIAESFSRVRYMHLVPQIIRHYELGQEDNKDPYGSGIPCRHSSDERKYTHSSPRKNYRSPSLYHASDCGPLFRPRRDRQAPFAGPLRSLAARPRSSR